MGRPATNSLVPMQAATATPVVSTLNLRDIHARAASRTQLCRSTMGSHARSPNRRGLEDHRRRRVARRADRKVDHTTLVTLRERGELVEFVVGIDRGTKPAPASGPGRSPGSQRPLEVGHSRMNSAVAASPALVEAGRYEHLLALIAFVYHLALPMDRRHKRHLGQQAPRAPPGDPRS